MGGELGHISTIEGSTVVQDNTFVDALIIGSGIAGLTVAWKLGKAGLNVLVVTKKNRAESNTNYAQGGIAAVVSPSDSVETHMNDTIKAGDGLCDERAVRFAVEQGPARVNELTEIGVQFSHRKSGDLDLGKEGGHTKRRVLHAEDLTGIEIERVLLSYCDQFSNIEIHENVMALDLAKNRQGKVAGCYILVEGQDEVVRVRARYTIIAAGGIGKVYLITSNPDIATGDGIAMGARAGASVANMEFTQFHPTIFYNPTARPSTFLISEALRGEGAILVDAKGERFMPEVDERAELAPRDVVARAIDNILKRTGAECVYLDLSHQPADFIKERFPGIYRKLLEAGYDLTKEPIPVVPAAHYACGGILTDLNGRSDLPNLYAVGEASNTGLHGANRMASNSLLEAVVFGHSCAEDIIARFRIEPVEESSIPEWRTTHPQEHVLTESDDQILVSQDWDEIRLTMTNYVGIVRSDKRLQRALRRILIIRDEVEEYWANYKINTDVVELYNLLEVAELIIRSAIERRESRGIHYNIDYPSKSEQLYPTILKKIGYSYTYSRSHPFISFSH